VALCENPQQRHATAAIAGTTTDSSIATVTIGTHLRIERSFISRTNARCDVRHMAS
jgi:hypothetical protein